MMMGDGPWTPVPGGWVGPVQTLPPDKYLSHAIWVGDAVPHHVWGPPYGLSDEPRVFLFVYQAWDRSPKGWLRRIAIASMDADLLVPAAIKWLASLPAPSTPGRDPDERQ